MPDRRATRTTGGSLPLAAFLKKSTQYGGLSQKVTLDSWPLTFSVQVSLLVPNPGGTLMAKTPCCWNGSKCVG